MLVFILRGLVAGFLLVGVTEIARFWPRIAATLLFVPLAIPLVFVMMYLRQPDLPSIARLSRHALLLIPLSLPMFLPMAFAQRLGFSFWGALVTALALAGLTVGVYLSLRLD